MKARKKQPVVTRQAILDAAADSFSMHGFAGTSISAVVAEAGLTKGALFHHFSDKRQLALEWTRDCLLPRLVEGWVAPLEEIESLAGMIDFLRQACVDLRPDDACSALVAVAAELADHDAEMSEALEAVFAEWRRGIGQMLARGQSDGWIHRSIQPQAEAGILVSMIAGFSVVMKCRRDDGFRHALSSSMVAYLETLRPA